MSKDLFPSIPRVFSFWESFGNRLNMAVKVKMEPFSPLSAHSSPPINSTRRFEIESPRPVPPYLRVREESPWAKGSKITDRSFLESPMPVSLISKCKIHFCGIAFLTLTIKRMLPSLVNLTAFDTKFVKTCFSRI